MHLRWRGRTRGSRLFWGLDGYMAGLKKREDIRRNPQSWCFRPEMSKIQHRATFGSILLWKTSSPLSSRQPIHQIRSTRQRAENGQQYDLPDPTKSNKGGAGSLRKHATSRKPPETSPPAAPAAARVFVTPLQINRSGHLSSRWLW